MAKPLISDDLWNIIEPYIPVKPRKKYHTGRKPYALLEVGITPCIARRHTEHGSGLGVYRWVVERTLSWLHQFRRL